MFAGIDLGYNAVKAVGDIQQGRLQLLRALEILDTADDYGVHTAVARRLIAAAD